MTEVPFVLNNAIFAVRHIDGGGKLMETQQGTCAPRPGLHCGGE
jgi:hypothetical protein